MTQLMLALHFGTVKVILFRFHNSRHLNYESVQSLTSRFVRDFFSNLKIYLYFA